MAISSTPPYCPDIERWPYPTIEEHLQTDRALEKLVYQLGPGELLIAFDAMLCLLEQTMRRQLNDERGEGWLQSLREVESLRVRFLHPEKRMRRVMPENAVNAMGAYETEMEALQEAIERGDRVVTQAAAYASNHPQDVLRHAFPVYAYARMGAWPRSEAEYEQHLADQWRAVKWLYDELRRRLAYRRGLNMGVQGPPPPLRDWRLTLECLCADDFGAGYKTPRDQTQEDREHLAQYKATRAAQHTFGALAKAHGFVARVTDSDDRDSHHSDCYVDFAFSQRHAILKLLNQAGLQGDIVDVPSNLPPSDVMQLEGEPFFWRVERRLPATTGAPPEKPMQLTEFQLNLVLLDAALTDHPWPDVFQVAVQRQWKPEDFFEGGDRLYYLSDGGYSRVGWSHWNGRLFLASESLAHPKQVWPLVERLRRAVEDGMRQWWQEQTDEPYPTEEPS